MSACTAQQQGLPDEGTAQEAVDTLFMLTSFESFEALARPGRSPEEIARILIRLARAALGTRSNDPRDAPPLDTKQQEQPWQEDSPRNVSR